MTRHLSMQAFRVALVTIALTASAASAQSTAQHHDSTFEALQQRGKHAMGVDQYTSAHLFDDLPSGGRIELQRAVDDTAGVRTIREHLRTVAAAFRKGDFSTPAFVHARNVPGTSVMAARRTSISYTYRDLPRGGEIVMETRDPEAVRAIHEFLAFQRGNHHAGGKEMHEHH